LFPEINGERESDSDHEAPQPEFYNKEKSFFDGGADLLCTIINVGRITFVCGFQ